MSSIWIQTVFAIGREQKHEDLQLPQDSNICEVKTVTVASEPKIKFREKKVTTLSGTGNSIGTVGFRKSKFGANRSIRTTDDSEDG